MECLERDQECRDCTVPLSVAHCATVPSSFILWWWLISLFLMLLKSKILSHTLNILEWTAQWLRRKFNYLCGTQLILRGFFDLQKNSVIIVYKMWKFWERLAYYGIRNEMIMVICWTVHLELGDNNAKVSYYISLSIYYRLASAQKHTFL